MLSWDPIVSIEPLGPMQVWDIEVEGTHNFIGNGIFAHNTYLPKNDVVAAHFTGARMALEGFLGEPTLSHYQLLSDSQKAELRLKVDEVLVPGPGTPKGIKYASVQDFFGDLVYAGKDMRRSVGHYSEFYPDIRFVSLGASPVTVMKTVELMHQMEDPATYDPAKYQYVAFSNEADREPTADERKAYRNYLSGFALDPKSIISRQGYTFLIDYTHRGKSLNVFIKGILEEWAREQAVELGQDPDQFVASLRSKIGLRILHQVDFLHPDFPDSEWAKVPDAYPQELNLPVEYLVTYNAPYGKTNVQRTDPRLMGALSNSEAYFGRLMPKYPPSQWTQKVPGQEDPLRLALTIFGMIERLNGASSQVQQAKQPIVSTSYRPDETKRFSSTPAPAGKPSLPEGARLAGAQRAPDKSVQEATLPGGMAAADPVSQVQRWIVEGRIRPETVGTFALNGFKAPGSKETELRTYYVAATPASDAENAFVVFDPWKEGADKMVFIPRSLVSGDSPVEITLGRSSKESQVQIAASNEGISRRHLALEIRPEAGDYSVRVKALADGGVYANGRKIPKGGTLSIIDPAVSKRIRGSGNVEADHQWLVENFRHDALIHPADEVFWSALFERVLRVQGTEKNLERVVREKTGAADWDLDHWRRAEVRPEQIEAFARHFANRFRRLVLRELMINAFQLAPAAFEARLYSTNASDQALQEMFGRAMEKYAQAKDPYALNLGEFFTTQGSWLNKAATWVGSAEIHAEYARNLQPVQAVSSSAGPVPVKSSEELENWFRSTLACVLDEATYVAYAFAVGRGKNLPRVLPATGIPEAIHTDELVAAGYALGNGGIIGEEASLRDDETHPLHNGIWDGVLPLPMNPKHINYFAFRGYPEDLPAPGEVTASGEVRHKEDQARTILKQMIDPIQTPDGRQVYMVGWRATDEERARLETGGARMADGRLAVRFLSSATAGKILDDIQARIDRERLSTAILFPQGQRSALMAVRDSKGDAVPREYAPVPIDFPRLVTGRYLSEATIRAVLADIEDVLINIDAKRALPAGESDQLRAAEKILTRALSGARMAGQIETGKWVSRTRRGEKWREIILSRENMAEVQDIVFLSVRRLFQDADLSMEGFEENVGFAVNRFVGEMAENAAKVPGKGATQLGEAVHFKIGISLNVNDRIVRIRFASNIRPSREQLKVVRTKIKLPDDRLNDEIAGHMIRIVGGRAEQQWEESGGTGVGILLVREEIRRLFPGSIVSFKYDERSPYPPVFTLKLPIRSDLAAKFQPSSGARMANDATDPTPYLDVMKRELGTALGPAPAIRASADTRLPSGGRMAADETQGLSTNSLLNRLRRLSMAPFLESALSDAYTRRHVHFYDTLLQLMDTRNLFDGFTLYHPAGGADYLTARYVDTVVIDSSYPEGAPKEAERILALIGQEMSKLKHSWIHVKGDAWKKDSYEVATSKPKKMILLKGAPKYLAAYSRARYQTYLDLVDSVLRTGDRILILDLLDQNDGVDYLRSKGYKEIKWLSDKGFDRLNQSLLSKSIHRELGGGGFDFIIPEVVRVFEKLANVGARLAETPGAGSGAVDLSLRGPQLVSAPVPASVTEPGTAAGSGEIANGGRMAAAEPGTEGLGARLTEAGKAVEEAEPRFQSIYDVRLNPDWIISAEGVDDESIGILARIFVSLEKSGALRLAETPFQFNNGNALIKFIQAPGGIYVNLYHTGDELVGGKFAPVGSILLTEAVIEKARAGKASVQIKAGVIQEQAPGVEALAELGRKNRLAEKVLKAVLPYLQTPIALYTAVDRDKINAGDRFAIAELAMMEASRRRIHSILSEQGKEGLVRFLFTDKKGSKIDKELSDDLSDWRGQKYERQFMGVPNRDILSRAKAEEAGFLSFPEIPAGNKEQNIIPYHSTYITAIAVAGSDHMDDNVERLLKDLIGAERFNSLANEHGKAAIFDAVKRVTDPSNLGFYRDLAVLVQKLNIDLALEVVRMVTRAVGSAA